MLKKFNTFFNLKLNSKIKKIRNTGFKVCFVIILYSTFILSVYLTTDHSYILYFLGTTIFKTATIFIAFLYIYGIVFNKLINES